MGKHKHKLKNTLITFQAQKAKTDKLKKFEATFDAKNSKKKRLFNRNNEIALSKGKSLLSDKLSSMTKSERRIYSKERLKHAKCLYEESDKILLLGEGNFSFSAALCKLLKNGSKIWSTCFDSKETLFQKYPESLANIEEIEGYGSKIFFNVDATKLDKHQKEFTRKFNEENNIMGLNEHVKQVKFNKIVFNFPHCGLGIKDQARNIESNQKLLLGIFKSAYSLSQPDGELHLTIKSGLPYEQWRITSLAKQEGHWLPGGCIPFDPKLYPGYEHRRTLGFKEGFSSTDNQEISDKFPKTYIFHL